jgi:eukaryotic-like serine/threonine-protein kinase
VGGVRENGAEPDIGQFDLRFDLERNPVEEDRTVIQRSAARSMRPGTRLNNVYEIERLVAQGGMGEVYRGFNIQTGDPVAIKMIRPEFASDPEILDLFRREASILHSFTNDAIVRYFVFSVDPQLGRAYLAMEFVEGPSLKKRLGSGPLALAEVRILQKRVASALEAAHGHGVVHRDISPDNLIMPDGDVRSAKVIDFGIARARRAGEGTILGGGFAGKLNYASPEQLGLAGADVTAKSDIYSFGLVLAEALLGRPIDMAGSQAEMVDKRRVIPAELAWIDPTIRPLLQAMLQPLPENRPSSMAEVAAWEPPAPTTARALKAPPLATERSGRMPALIGALIAVLSLGGAAYVFRDDLGHWAGTFSAPAPSAGLGEVAATSPTTKLPPLTSQQLPPLAPSSGSLEGTGTPSSPLESTSPGQPETARIEPPPASEPTGPPPRPVTAETLADALPPKSAQANVDLPPATVGSAYRAELPTFADPGGKGLRLAASGLPDGLTFSDAGGGKGAIEGVPQQPTRASIRIVATNLHDRTAQMTATLVVADQPAPPPGPVAKLETPTPAPLQKPSPLPVLPQSSAPPQSATPQVSAPPSSAPTVLAVMPAPVDQSAPPAAPPVGATQQTAAREETHPTRPSSLAPSDSSALSVAPASAEEKAKAFIARFDGGECFLVEPLPGSTKAHEYQAVGRAIEPFRRFDSGYKREVGVEANLRVAPITAEQCPALDLVRLAGPGRPPLPRLTLKNYEVGPGQPLLGTISNLKGRRLYLVLVDNDGLAHRLEAKADASGDSATFSVPLTADASSVGPMQMLLAIVSDKPIPAFDSLHSANLKLIGSRLIDEARGASAAVEADFFKFVN